MKHHLPVRLLSAGLLALTLLTAPMAAAAEDAIRVELNKVEPNGEACRAYIVIENATGRALETLKLDLVLFDTDGVVAKRLAVETAPLPTGKTGLKMFDITGLACPALGRVLLNDVLDCADASGPVADCLALVTPSAKGGLSFIK